MAAIQNTLKLLLFSFMVVSSLMIMGDRLPSMVMMRRHFPRTLSGMLLWTAEVSRLWNGYT